MRKPLTNRILLEGAREALRLLGVIPSQVTKKAFLEPTMEPLVELPLLRNLSGSTRESQSDISQCIVFLRSNQFEHVNYVYIENEVILLIEILNFLVVQPRFAMLFQKLLSISFYSSVLLALPRHDQILHNSTIFSQTYSCIAPA